MMIDAAQKVVTLDTLVAQLAPIRKSGRKIVFTNGCFDILHVGHVRYLAAARSAGDVLVIGLNSDISVQKIKGPKRPIIDQAQRAEVLASLGFVDFVVLFEEPEPLRLIEVVKPNTLVKGEDWGEDKIIGSDFVKSIGGRVVRIKFTDQTSTSGIIARIIERYTRS